MDILTEVLHSHTEYDIANYFRSEVVAEKLSKMPHAMASGGISPERFLREDHQILHTYRGQ